MSTAAQQQSHGLGCHTFIGGYCVQHLPSLETIDLPLLLHPLSYLRYS
ncbi:MAG: hypothetical protein ICV79_11100 [Flavisolibacter sp.]|nr:hypothetical protein [Flavisolibacter sp.]